MKSMSLKEDPQAYPFTKLEENGKASLIVIDPDRS